jgi:hypothetical protein
MKSRLEYMDNSEARVCQPCYSTLAKGMFFDDYYVVNETTASVPLLIQICFPMDIKEVHSFVISVI